MLAFDDIKKVCEEELMNSSDILFCSVFGSYAKSKQRADSDIDLAIAGRQKLTFEEKFNISQKLSDRLKKQIDLVDLQAVAGVILQQALSKGKIIFVKDRNLYAELIKKMLYNQADMMPYYNRILKERRERFLNGQTSNLQQS